LIIVFYFELLNGGIQRIEVVDNHIANTIVVKINLTIVFYFIALVSTKTI